MNGIIDWFAKNHVAANLLMALLMVGGLITIPMLNQQMIPDIDLEVVKVVVPYPGASPEEVEQAICIRVEEAVQSLHGIKHIRSTAAEGVGSTTIELLAGEDVARRLADIRARVDSIDTFPDEARRPVVSQAEIGKGVLSIALSGKADERTLKRLGQRIRDEMMAQPGITQVALGSVRDDEISIEISEDALRRYGLRFDDVVQAVRRSSMDLPGGSIKTSGGEILLRAKGQAYQGEAFERIPIVTRPDGTRLVVGDVARVEDGFAESPVRSIFDGQPAVLLTVFQVGDEKMLEVAKAAKAYVAGARQRMPEGVTLTVWQNGAHYLADRLGSMLRNARSGLILVVLILALFLRLRLAFWVSLGIPTAFLGCVAVLPMMDISINWISLLAFIVVLGIVVDDAIVVAENTHTEQQKTGNKLHGAIRGAQGIAVPVIFGVATTVAAFAPMLFIPGSMGKITAVLPSVVIACLLFSLIEAMLVLPSHLAGGKATIDAPPQNPLSKQWRAVQDRVALHLDRLIHHHYKRALDLSLEWRYLTLAGAVAILFLTVGLLGGGWIHFTFQEPVEGDMINASLTMAPGTPADVTERAVRQLEAAARVVQSNVDQERGNDHGSIFSHMMTSVGIHPSTYQRMDLNARGGSGSQANLGEVQVELIDPAYRGITAAELQRRWRETVGAIPGMEELTFKNSMVSAGAPIEVELRGHDLKALRGAADEVKTRLSKYQGVFDLRDSFRAGKQELQFRILPSAEALGLSLQDLARQVRQAFYGEEAERIQRGRDDVRVMVRYPEERRHSLTDVENMRIRAVDGTEVPFPSVASAKLAEGYSAIHRVDRERVVSVTGDVDVGVANANEVVADLRAKVLPAVLPSFPGVHYAFEGEQAEQHQFLKAMLRGQFIALLAIYALLAIPLRSYLQPLIIMTAIPFGLVGAAFGHLLLGYDFSMYSVIGFVALSGVVVNDSLVLVDYMNQLRAEGARMEEAVRDAPLARFRPILLTSITTFAGLTPMMMERSMSAQFMIPMAISIGFGVIFASFITLFLVPCICLAVEDAKMWMAGRHDTRRPAGAGALVEGLGESGAPAR